MKSKIFVTAILLLNIIVFSGIALSQQNEKIKKTPEEIAGKKSERMKKNLSLSEDQYKEVYSLILKKSQDRISNKEKVKSMDKNSKKEFRKLNKEKFQQQLQGILTKEQLDKMNSLKENRKHNKKDKKYKTENIK